MRTPVHFVFPLVCVVVLGVVHMWICACVCACAWVYVSVYVRACVVYMCCAACVCGNDIMAGKCLRYMYLHESRCEEF